MMCFFFLILFTCKKMFLKNCLIIKVEASDRKLDLVLVLLGGKIENSQFS